MSWINPLYLWALPLGLIPIVIYYLMRFRALRVDWGAQYVLELALQRLKRRLRLDQLLLLILRVALCLMLVAAFARPTAGRGRGPITGSGVHHVVVLDASQSMAAAAGDASRFDRARQMLKQLTATWGRGEVWSLYLLDDEPRWVVDGLPVESPEKTAALLDSLAPGQGSASLAQAMEVITGKFAQQPLELFIAADDQATTWAQLEQARPLPAGTRACWIDVGGDNHDNLAVTAVHPASERLLAQHPSRVYVHLRNFAPQAIEDVPLQLHIDGVFASEQLVSVQPGLESVVWFDYSIDGPGSHYLTARLREDALNVDNALHAAVQVDRQISLLLLRDPTKTGKFDSTWGALTAINDMQDSCPEAIQMGPITMALEEGELTAQRLAGVDAVLIDGGTALTPALATLLKNYAQAGGGLIIALDDAVDGPAWNQMLGEAGLLPAALGPLHNQPYGGLRFNSLARSDFGDELLRVFESEEAGNLQDARVFAWFDLLPEQVPVPAGHERRVLARFEDGQPFALSQRGPLGCVILLASDLCGRGNTLIVREFYLPLVIRLVNEASAGGIFSRNLDRRQPVRLALSPGETLQAATFQMQQQAPLPLTPAALGQRQVLTLAQGSERSGLGSILTVSDAGTSRVWFAIQGQPLDSDLTAVTPAGRQAALTQLSMVAVRDWQQLDALLLADRRGQEWHTWLIAALLGMLLLEMFLQRRFVVVR